MLRRYYDRNQKAQIFLEYVIVIGSVILVIFAMSTLVKRGTQGMIKVVADQIGNQAEADQDFDKGYLESSYTLSRTNSTKRKTEFAGNTTYTFRATTVTSTNVLIDMGFTEKN